MTVLFAASRRNAHPPPAACADHGEQEQVHGAKRGLFCFAGGGDFVRRVGCARGRLGIVAR